MTSCQPLSVSVIIAVYNGQAFLGEAIESARRQTRPPAEIIVVDDGSTDATPLVAARAGDAVRCLRQPNRGPSAARNRGFRESRGRVICFLDADDVWPDDALALLLDLLERDDAVDIAMGNSRIFRCVQSSAGPPTKEFYPTTQVLSIVGTTAIRRSMFDRVGLFDETMRSGEDLDWLLRARERGVKISTRPETVHHYRRHSANSTNDFDERIHCFLRTLRCSIARRRESGDSLAPLRLTRFRGWDDA